LTTPPLHPIGIAGLAAALGILKRKKEGANVDLQVYETAVGASTPPLHGNADDLPLISVQIRRNVSRSLPTPFLPLSSESESNFDFGLDSGAGVSLGPNAQVTLELLGVGKEMESIAGGAVGDEKDFW
jgi:hypothetical protein